MLKNPVLALSRALLLFAVVLLVALYLYPVSNRYTRAGGLVLIFFMWAGALVLCWRWKGVRYALLGLTALLAGFLALPGRATPGAAVLRADYAAAMRGYEGVEYYWGGEGARGIDCSGLIRRGLVNAQLSRGVRNFDPELVRRGLALWWNDTTARVLGEAPPGVTTHVLDAPSLNALDHSLLLPGDLAVKIGRAHV